MRLPAGARFELARLDDGFSLGMHATKIRKQALSDAVAPLHAARSTMFVPQENEVLLTLGFLEHIKSARAKLADSAVKSHDGSQVVEVEVDFENAQQAVAAHVTAMALPLPHSLATSDLQEADALFLRGNFAASELALRRLATTYPLHAWALVRLGDLAALSADTDGACALYAAAQADGPERTSSILAAARARVLLCEPRPHLDWVAMFGRNRRDDALGHRLAQEAGWALNYENDLETISALVRESADALPSKSYQMVLSRALRQLDTFALASISERDLPLAKHPEGFDLYMLLGNAWCQLDAPGAWPQFSKIPARSFVSHLDAKKRRAWLVRTHLCQLVPATIRKAAHAHATLFLPQKHLQNIENRLLAAKNAALQQTHAPTQP